ncbi:MAG: hypothetical protein NVS3B21_18370 [Acidimicrobiales bacterium]
MYYIQGGGMQTMSCSDGNDRAWERVIAAQGVAGNSPRFVPTSQVTWPLAQNPSSTENNGILLELHHNRGAMAYGIEELDRGNPLAWPGLASEQDVRGLVSTMISVNECDPLRDEGINFYRLLLRAGVAARCRQVMGTIHATEVIPMVCPDISRDTARSIADFARD